MEKNTTALIIGSARGRRHLDPTRSIPFSLESFGGRGRVLDWILYALESEGIPGRDRVFVGGYHIQKVIRDYPDLRFFFHERWETEGEAAALALAVGDISGPAFVCSSDVVFRPEALSALRRDGFDVVVGFPGTPGDDDPDSALPAHPVGPAWLSAAAVEMLPAIFSRGPLESRDMFWLFGELEKSGLRMACVDIRAHCGLLRDRLSLSRFVFGTKAITLERIRPLMKSAVVLDQVRFSVGRWREDAGAVLAEIRERLCGPDRLVVRSSALAEDTWSSSQAGRFESVLGVDGASDSGLKDAVERVIAAYPDTAGPEVFAANEVFVQPQLDRVSVCGVIFTRDQQSNAPYTIINLDRKTGRTDVVTSGGRHPTETFVVSDRTVELGEGRGFLRPLLDVAGELESLVGYDRLDIEFAVDTDSVVYVFQVRPLAGSAVEMEVSQESLRGEMAEIKHSIECLMRPACGLAGRTTMLGDMPDWNPAEMIGAAPRPLARSLYQVLITDGAWAEARRRMGYRDTTAHPLMHLLCGVPYIDLRASFNSFLPACVPDGAAGRIVDCYTDCLRARPELHDKIEFDVAVTCMAFDFEKQIARLESGGLRRDDAKLLADGLRALTDDFVLGRGGCSIEECMGRVGLLAARRKAALASIAAPRDIPRAVRLLVCDCIRFGTVPFSILARHGFVAMTFLRSMVARGALEQELYHAILAAVPTVASDISAALCALSAGAMERAEFVRDFGHLRPGTYDILSSNYAVLADVFAGKKAGVGQARNPASGRAREMLAAAAPRVDELIAEAGLGFSAEELFGYILAAVPAREKAKFEFTKNISAVLESVAAYFAHFNLSRDDASYVSIEKILRMATDSRSGAEDFECARTVAFEAKRHALTRSLRLPHLITRPGDVDCFCMEEWRPNFITSKKVLAPLCRPDEGAAAGGLSGRIALIRSADPGYDWIFACGISGLITQFGGAASHMAIRAAEFGLPSAIGCGDDLFEKISRAESVELDCANRIIKVF